MDHVISILEITLGDHIYVRAGLGFTISKEGIVVPGQDWNNSEQWMVVTNDVVQPDGSFPQLRLVTLNEFQAPELKLRRVRYNQGGEILHHIKLEGTSYVEQQVPIDAIAENALLLYLLSQSSDVYGDQLQTLLGEQYKRFSYICSTTYAKDWALSFNLNSFDPQLSFDDKQNSSSAQATVESVAAERNSTSRGYECPHAVETNELRRGDHIYAWRKGIIYQHHAIVIGRSDVPEEGHRTHPIPIIQDLMVIENNRTDSPCIRIVTLAHFANNYRIQRVQYGRNNLVDVFCNDIKMRGKCHFQDSLLVDDIVKNALFLYHCGDPNRQSQMGEYDFLFHNCEHFAFACSTDGTLIDRYEQKNQLPDYRSQQWQATLNVASSAAVTAAWHTLDKTEAWKYLIESILPSMKGFSQPILKVVVNGASFQQALQSFIRIAGPVAGIVSGIACFVEIALLSVRHIIYLTTEGLKRTKALAIGLAIELAQFVKGIIQSIVSNGLTACCSLIGGALGLLIPIPFINILLSVAFGFAGFALGRYIGGVPSNLYLYHKNKKDKDHQRKMVS
ncbi:unnamed protein product [Adineta steineri]|uniref:LRAT domain-containing protein n=1 Tax=Adineta steineri TaxID=433720 RepID=A0A814P2G6_9BILA|nr:unnamed protein product [Adineta steineri]CAF3850626.1 unnamed protein product [Adineta steineri]